MPYPEGLARGDYGEGRPMSGLTHEQMMHDSPISMLYKNQSEIKTSKQHKGVAPEMMSSNFANHVPLETSGTVVQEMPAGIHDNAAEYEMPSKNYFNHFEDNNAADEQFSVHQE